MREIIRMKIEQLEKDKEVYQQRKLSLNTYMDSFLVLHLFDAQIAYLNNMLDDEDNFQGLLTDLAHGIELC